MSEQRFSVEGLRNLATEWHKLGYLHVADVTKGCADEIENLIIELDEARDRAERQWDRKVHWSQRVDDLLFERARLRTALQEAASTLQDLAASCRMYGHNKAATSAEACEQYVRAELAKVPAEVPT